MNVTGEVDRPNGSSMREYFGSIVIIMQFIMQVLGILDCASALCKEQLCGSV